MAFPTDSFSPTYLPPDSASFRSVLGRFATGVTVLATYGGEDVQAMTANAFTALSLDPPLVLVCLRPDSRLLRAARSTGRFSVNVLAHHQEEIARALAAPHKQPSATAGVHWMQDRDGLPLLRGALAHLHCSLENSVQGGDHQIVIGRVHALDRHDGEPLLFVDGEFLRHSRR